MSTEGAETPPPAEVLAEIKAVVAKAKGGDAAAIPRLRELLDQYPRLWKQYGDLAGQAERAWIHLAAGADLHLRESLVKFAADQRAALTRPDAPPIEKLLVDRAVVAGLQLQYFVAVEAAAVTANEPPRLLQYRARRQAQAQKMCESAVAALLNVQKLVPAKPPASEAATSAAAPVTGPESAGWDVDVTGGLPNRLEAFFQSPAGAREAAAASN